MTEIAERKPRRSGRGEPGSRVNRASLLLDVVPDDAQRSAPAGYGEVQRGPEDAVHGMPVHAAGEFRSQPPGRHAVEAVHERRHSRLRRILSEQVHMVVLAVEFAQLRAEVTAHLPHRILARSEHVRVQHAAPVLRHEDQMNVERGCHVPATPGSPRGLS
jgi:hypothetical protein